MSISVTADQISETQKYGQVIVQKYIGNCDKLGEFRI